jgi:exodeoxyribonuclease V alpha subunit
MIVGLDSGRFLADLFPEAGSDLLRLYAGAEDQAGLLHADYYTIRDLLDLSGYGARQAVHALLLALTLALEEGSPCIELDEDAISRRLGDLAGEADARSWATRVVAELREGLPDLVSDAVADGKPVVRHDRDGRAFLYFQKYLKHELTLESELRRRLARTGNPPACDLAAILGEVLAESPDLRDGRALRLNARQRLAIALALSRDFVIVSGGPGTGKTSVVFTLLRCLIRAGVPSERIALAAPTGRAAQGLTNAIRSGLDGLSTPGPDAPLRDIAATTLHTLLGYYPSRGSFRHRAENPLPHDVVIVDEVSMVGLALMAQLVQALKDDARLLLLGDKDQLPSVDAGAVLANLVRSDEPARYSKALCTQVARIWNDVRLVPAKHDSPLDDVLVVLDENYRSQPEIALAARAVNMGRVEIVDELPAFSWGPASAPDGAAVSGCRVLQEAHAGVEAWHRLLGSWAEQHYLAPTTGSRPYAELVATMEQAELDTTAEAPRELLDALFRQLDGARILTLVREGPWGCCGINDFLGQLLRPRLGRRRSGGGVVAGTPLLINRNDHTRLLFNGDVGVVLRGRAGSLRAVFRRPDGYASFPLESLPARESAYALTVHKSQGSEYRRVMLVLPPKGARRLLTREIVYTGITRAKELAVIAASKDVLRFAISRRIVRDTGLHLA